MKPQNRNKKVMLVIGIMISASWLSSTSPERWGSNDEEGNTVKIRGIYGSPGDIWKEGLDLPDLGINAVFIRYSSVNPEMIDRARSERQKIFLEFPVLNGKSYLEEHPEAWPVNEKGERVNSAGWFMGICPTNPEFKAFRMDQLRKLLDLYDIDGVWMDYFHWHAQFEDHRPILPETCFCDRCLSSFEAYTGMDFRGPDIPATANMILEYHQDEWRDWRCSVLSGWARDLKQLIQEHDPSILLGLYHCPWDDHEFNGARRNILGLDYNMLREYVDVFSPMVYHARMGRPPEWIRENIEWFSSIINPMNDRIVLIWPIIQTYDDPYRISEEEFQSLFEYGISGDATGIMVFTSASIAEDNMKTRLLKTIYMNLKDNQE